MNSINALSIAPNSKDWLANSHHAHILHVFDHACNLINERREVLSIVTPQIGNGPFNLMTENDILFSDHLDAESPVSIHTSQLNLGDLTINTANAKLWSPRPDWEVLHAKRENILSQIMSLRGDCFGWENTALATTLPITNYPTSIPISQLTTFSTALANSDLPAVIAAAKHLAGLGIGLTPSGDDFIMGGLYAAWIIQPFETTQTLAQEIANVAAPLTTSLSAAWLKSAGKGEAGILWHELFNALVSADTMSVQSSMDKILDVGETSGADALTGFISTFIAYAESETKLCPS